MSRWSTLKNQEKADGQQSSIEILPEALSRAVEKGMFNTPTQVEQAIDGDPLRIIILNRPAWRD